MAQYTIEITGERLAAMADNEMGVYVTPGSNTPYWASSPSFTYDVALGSAQDVADAISSDFGYEIDIDDLREDEDVYEVVLSDDDDDDDEE